MATKDVNLLMSMEKYGESYLQGLSEQMASFYTQPEKYLECSVDMQKQLLNASKKVYDFMKDIELYSSNQSSLDELLVNGFDNEQIWQEIQLQNNPCLSQLKGSLRGLKIDNLNLCGGNSGAAEKTKRVKKDKDKGKKAETRDGGLTASGDVLEEDNFFEEDIDFEVDGNQEKVSAKKYKSTVVDDAFFRLREMEECLDIQDKVEEMRNNEDNAGADNNEDSEDNEDEDGDGDDIDFFNDAGEDSSMYKQFFDPPAIPGNSKHKIANKQDGVQLEVEGINEKEGEDDEGEIDDDSCDDMDNEVDEEDENEDENEDEISEDDGVSGDGDLGENENEVGEGVHEDKEDGKVESKFERKQKQMREKIAKLEAVNLSEKPWQLSGEANAKKRPLNSLLEEYLTFDHTSVGAPAVTEETTLSLEDLIKQRIKDQAWDDVQRKEKAVVQPFEYKRAPEFNQEKSKLSLADVYEKEYLKQTTDDKEEKEDEEHVNIRNLMDHLFVQLDALSNFHFAPKPPRPEIKVITNAPSLQMEEVLPITMTAASQLAPEEIYDKKKGELVGAEEKDDEDRKRERRQKKIKKKFSAKAKERKEKLKAQKSGKIAKSETKKAFDSLKKGVRNTIVDNRTTEKSVKSSNEFFSKLQQEVKENISKESLKGKKASRKPKKSAEFLKL